MALPFFPDEWESLLPEELSTARAKLAGFIEAVPDKEKLLREVIRYDLGYGIYEWSSAQVCWQLLGLRLRGYTGIFWVIGGILKQKCWRCFHIIAQLRVTSHELLIN